MAANRVDGIRCYGIHGRGAQRARGADDLDATRRMRHFEEAPDGTDRTYLQDGCTMGVQKSAGWVHDGMRKRT